jgi:signal transduction histidine kinase
VDKARSRELGGTGLGLAIVRHIAIAHGGEVSVESWEGEGSTFRLRLPLS